MVGDPPAARASLIGWCGEPDRGAEQLAPAGHPPPTARWRVAVVAWRLSRRGAALQGFGVARSGPPAMAVRRTARVLGASAPWVSFWHGQPVALTDSPCQNSPWAAGNEPSGEQPADLSPRSPHHSQSHPRRRIDPPAPATVPSSRGWGCPAEASCPRRGTGSPRPPIHRRPERQAGHPSPERRPTTAGHRRSDHTDGFAQYFFVSFFMRVIVSFRRFAPVRYWR